MSLENNKIDGRGKNPNSRNGFKRGHKVPIKWRKNVSKVLKGKSLSEQHKNKIREARVGKSSGMLGKHHSPETKAKIGIANKGKEHKPFTEEIKRKMSERYKGKHISPNTEFKKKQFANEKHPFWKGDKVGYVGLHQWVRRNKPKPQLCEECNEFPPYDVANISGKYKRDINDFEWLCRKCHFKLHFPNGRIGNNLGRK